jgi:hypothetical protein
MKSSLPANKKRGRRGQLKRAPDDEPISVLLTTSNTYATPPPRRPRRRASTEADQKMTAWNDDLKSTPQSMLLTMKEGVIYEDKSLFKAFDFPRTLTKNLECRSQYFQWDPDLPYLANKTRPPQKHTIPCTAERQQVPISVTKEESCSTDCALDREQTES